jgi:hypothetical protein
MDMTPEEIQSLRDAADAIERGRELEATRTITIEPEWNNTAAYFAAGLRDHAFERGATEPIVSFIEQVRYLTQTDLPAVERLIERVKRGR